MRIGLLMDAPPSFSAMMECIAPTEAPIRFGLDQDRFAESRLTQTDLEEVRDFLMRVTAKKATAADQSRFMSRVLGDDWLTRYRLTNKNDPVVNPVLPLAMAFIQYAKDRRGVFKTSPVGSAKSD